MRARAIAWGAALGAAFAACGPRPEFRCSVDAQCGDEGRCEPNFYCSFPDLDCPSGRRFGELAGAGVANDCVDEAEPVATTTGDVADDGIATIAEDTTPVVPMTMSTSGDPPEGSSSGVPPSTTEDDDGASSGESSTLGEGLVLHLPLDDDFAASVAADASGNGLDASCTQCPVSVPGRVGMAAGFSSDAVLVIADDPLLRPSEAMTIAIWALDADPTAMQTQFLVGKVLTSLYNSFQISTSAGLVGRPDEMVFRVIDDVPTSYDEYVVNPLQARTWHHLAGVWDGSAGSLWLDGAVIAEFDAPAIAYDTGPFTVGADNNDGAFLYWYRGALDEVRLYDRALTAEEIGELAAER